MSRRHRLVALPVAITCALFLTVPAQAQTQEPDDFGEPTAEQLARAVRTYEPVVRTFEPEVRPLETVVSEGEETVVTLAADILFDKDKWDLNDAARDRIAELVADVPQGATMAVHGHTDSVAGAVDNQELSENRADAVAAVIERARGDLDLEIEGFAATDPAVQEDPEDPSTFAANRRVELVYTD